MATNKNKLSSEEQALREKLNEADFHYQEADWKVIESEVSAAKWGKYKSLLKTAAAIVVLSGAVYFFNQKMQSQSEKADAQKTEEVSVEPSVEKPQSPNKENSDASPIKPEVEKAEVTTPDTQANEDTEKQIETSQKEIANKNPVDEETEAKEATVEQDNNQRETSDKEVAFKLEINGDYCLGEELELLAKANGQVIDGSKYNLRWFINDNRLIQKESQIKYNLDEAGLYKIKLKVNGKNGEPITSLEESVNVESLPEIDFTYEDGDGLFTDFSAEFKPRPKNLNYRWFVDDNEISLDENKVHNFHKKGVYFMRMAYTTKNNCIAEIEKPVAIMEDFGPFINAFNPESENDKVKGFMPNGFENHEGYFQFTIIDLSGRVVFESNSPHKKWNGRLNNSGERMPEGQYIWKINIADKSGNNRSFTDQVKLFYRK